MITICDHLRKLKFSASMPYAFTEHGALMAASVLNSARAIQVLDKLESRYDRQFKVVFDAIRELMRPPDSPRRRIGFVQDE